MSVKYKDLFDFLTHPYTEVFFFMKTITTSDKAVCHRYVSSKYSLDWMFAVLNSVVTKMIVLNLKSFGHSKLL